MDGLWLSLKYTLSTYARIGYPADSEEINTVYFPGFPRVRYYLAIFKKTPDTFYLKYLRFVSDLNIAKINRIAISLIFLYY